MLDVVTTALETVAVLLLIGAAGWAMLLAVGSPYGWPAALAASAVTALAASQALQWAATRAGGDAG